MTSPVKAKLGSNVTSFESQANTYYQCIQISKCQDVYCIQGHMIDITCKYINVTYVRLPVRYLNLTWNIQRQQWSLPGAAFTVLIGSGLQYRLSLHRSHVHLRSLG